MSVAVSSTLSQAIMALTPARQIGRVRAISPGCIEADGPNVSPGTLCEITTEVSSFSAEVLSNNQGRIKLLALEPTQQAKIGDKVSASTGTSNLTVGDDYAGRCVNALGLPLDDGPQITHDIAHTQINTPPAPLDRETLNVPLITGIRAIDALLPLNRGQRIGVFAPAGVGKTSLIRRIARDVDIDYTILCLVGERGLEVEAMWSALKSTPLWSSTTMVCATSDQSPYMRKRCVEQAIALGEYWRDKGQHVLLVVDSVTRYAMALREAGLAAGEPPTLRAYPPSVFSQLPRLTERCGALKSGGSITSIMTILSETDDNDDPIAEVMKSLLDGHIILSRDIAEAGRFPAIDISRSISRDSEATMSPKHLTMARQARSLIALYESRKAMIEAGLYKQGSDKGIDRAKSVHDKLIEFCTQNDAVVAPLQETLIRLKSALQ